MRQNPKYLVFLSLKFQFCYISEAEHSWCENSPDRPKIFHTTEPSIFLTTVRACITRKYCYLFIYCYDWQLAAAPADFADLSITHRLLLAPYHVSGFKKKKKIVFLNYVVVDTWVLSYSKLSNLLYPGLADLPSMLAVLRRQRVLAVNFWLLQKLGITLECCHFICRIRPLLI